MANHIILGVHITDRAHHAIRVQELLTEYGCNVKTRIGLHEVSDGACSPNGLLVLELVGSDDDCNELARKLTAVEGVDVKSMVFEHD